MPVEGHDPNAPRATGTPEPTGAAHDESVAGGSTEPGTLRQVEPPAWAMGDGPSSADSRSGKEVYELDREIQRSQAAGGTDSAEGYTLLSRLGTGSFGTVWEAENRLTGERVAIKFFTAGHADWAKLLGEVGLLQKVEGTGGIIMVKEVRPGGPGSRPHYVMQLANGGSLADWLKKAGTLPPRERVRLVAGIFARVARAMAAVHRRGIHHCDLKPPNILLHSPEPNAPPEPLVADFGQALLANDDTPALGTFFYMPPDQIEAAQAGTLPDTRWDVYALGAVVYEMLTGEAPRRTPELVERIKKSPKHLPTKMEVYREGLLNAPKPEAHRAIADPMLAKIIDRCLNLRPERRPADAGAVLALLDARARWRRTRPVLAFAAVATLLVVAIVTGLGLWFANKVTETAKGNYITEAEGSLVRTAGYGTRSVEDRFQRHIASVDAWADDAHTKDPVAIAALKEASAMPRGPTLKDGPPLSETGRDAIRAWLKRLHNQRKSRAAPNEHMPTLGVMLVTDDAASGTPQSRGFYLARVLSDGTLEDGASYKKVSDREFFRVDLSYRDYFHVGPGEATDVANPHPVVRASHVSHPFRSRGIDRSGQGDERVRWKLNIVSPIWDDPVKRERVIGLFVMGLDVVYDVKPLLYPTEFRRPDGEGAGYGIAEKVKVVVADHRGRWVWHPDCEKLLSSDRHLDGYPDLVRRHGFSGLNAGPWLNLNESTVKDDSPDRYEYTASDEYVDAMEKELNHEADPEIACFTRFDPYERSRYRGRDATGKLAPPRRWVFVAQVDRNSALAPLDQMNHDIVKGGTAVVAVIALIAIGLWIGLVMVLRRLEFATHG